MVWSWWNIALPLVFSAFSISDIAMGNIHTTGCLRINKILNGVLRCSLWAIWEWRNRVINVEPDMVRKVKDEDIFHSIQRTSKLWISATLKSGAANWNLAFVATVLGSSWLCISSLVVAVVLYILLYSWDGGLDVCVNVTGSSPLTQTGMVDFVTDQAIIDAAQRKRGKYMDKCAAIGYRFLPFSFSSLGELEADAVILLKCIKKFSITQDIRARTAIHIFNKISFVIVKGVGAQIVSPLSSNIL
ncbi:hypothetical protein Tco_1266111 [Tanacetum coccineum]